MSSAARSKAWRERNKSEDRWADTLRQLAVKSASRLRIKGRPTQCLITVAQIEEMGRKQGMRCYYSGIPFYLKGGKKHPFYPSLDRTEVNGDYSVDNCRLTSWLHNRGRSDMSAVDFINALQLTLESFASAPFHSEYHRLFLPRSGP